MLLYVCILFVVHTAAHPLGKSSDVSSEDSDFESCADLFLSENRYCDTIDYDTVNHGCSLLCVCDGTDYHPVPKGNSISCGENSVCINGVCTSNTASEYGNDYRSKEIYDYDYNIYSLNTENEENAISQDRKETSHRSETIPDEENDYARAIQGKEERKKDDESEINNSEYTYGTIEKERGIEDQQIFGEITSEEFESDIDIYRPSNEYSERNDMEAQELEDETDDSGDKVIGDGLDSDIYGQNEQSHNHEDIMNGSEERSPNLWKISHTPKPTDLNRNEDDTKLYSDFHTIDEITQNAQAQHSSESKGYHTENKNYETITYNKTEQSNVHTEEFMKSVNKFKKHGVKSVGDNLADENDQDVVQRKNKNSEKKIQNNKQTQNIKQIINSASYEDEIKKGGAGAIPGGDDNKLNKAITKSVSDGDEDRIKKETAGAVSGGGADDLKNGWWNGVDGSKKKVAEAVPRGSDDVLKKDITKSASNPDVDRMKKGAAGFVPENRDGDIKKDITKSASNGEVNKLKKGAAGAVPGNDDGVVKEDITKSATDGNVDGLKKGAVEAVPGGGDDGLKKYNSKSASNVDELKKGVAGAGDDGGKKDTAKTASVGDVDGLKKRPVEFIPGIDDGALKKYIAKSSSNGDVDVLKKKAAVTGSDDSALKKEIFKFATDGDVSVLKKGAAGSVPESDDGGLKKDITKSTSDGYVDRLKKGDAGDVNDGLNKDITDDFDGNEDGLKKGVAGAISGRDSDGLKKKYITKSASDGDVDRLKKGDAGAITGGGNDGLRKDIIKSNGDVDGLQKGTVGPVPGDGVEGLNKDITKSEFTYEKSSFVKEVSESEMEKA